MQKSQCHRKIEIGIYVMYMCLSGRNRFAFKEIMLWKIKCFWSTLVGRLHELNNQPTSLIKKRLIFLRSYILIFEKN